MIFNRIITVLLVVCVLFELLTTVKLYEVYKGEPDDDKKGWLAVAVLVIFITAFKELMELIMRGW